MESVVTFFSRGITITRQTWGGVARGGADLAQVRGGDEAQREAELSLFLAQTALKLKSRSLIETFWVAT